MDELCSPQKGCQEQNGLVRKVESDLTKCRENASVRRRRRAGHGVDEDTTARDGRMLPGTDRGAVRRAQKDGHARLPRDAASPCTGHPATIWRSIGGVMEESEIMQLTHRYTGGDHEAP